MKKNKNSKKIKKKIYLIKFKELKKKNNFQQKKY